MQKDYLLLVLILFVTPSCYVTRYSLHGDYVVNAIDTPDIKGEAVYGDFFHDDYIGIQSSIETGDNYISLHIENRTDATIKILWDEGSFIDPYGHAHRIYHTGVKFSEVNNTQVPTILPTNTIIDDIVAPADNVYYDNGWQYSPLIETEVYKNEEDARLALNDLQPIKLLIPIEINNTIREYLFTYDATNKVTQKVRQIDKTSTTLLITAVGVLGATAYAVLLVLLGLV